MSVLQSSVGEKGKNLRSDVETVQSLLKSKGFDPKGVDGICGKETIAAIRRFQATFLTNPDGLIEPGRKTWQKLASTGGAADPDLSRWSGDSARWPQEKKLRSMHPALRTKVETVLQGLKERGFQPTVF